MLRSTIHLPPIEEGEFLLCYVKVLMQDNVFRDFEKIPPLVEFSLQKSRNSCYTYKK